MPADAPPQPLRYLPATHDVAEHGVQVGAPDAMSVKGLWVFWSVSGNGQAPIVMPAFHSQVQAASKFGNAMSVVGQNPLFTWSMADRCHQIMVTNLSSSTYALL